MSIYVTIRLIMCGIAAVCLAVVAWKLYEKHEDLRGGRFGDG